MCAVCGLFHFFFFPHAMFCAGLRTDITKGPTSVLHHLCITIHTKTRMCLYTHTHKLCTRKYSIITVRMYLIRSLVFRLPIFNSQNCAFSYSARNAYIYCYFSSISTMALDDVMSPQHSHGSLCAFQNLTAAAAAATAVVYSFFCALCLCSRTHLHTNKIKQKKNITVH